MSPKKETLKSHEPESSNESTSGAEPQGKKKSNWTSKLALILAILALLLVIQEKMSTEKSAIKSVNQTITKKLVPQMKEAEDRASAAAIYDLKRVSVTLEEIKENSTNEEVRTLIDQIQMDIKDLSVKILVHE